ncbi:lipid-A-disaccharide synthase N-terminal domain-containing protein [Litchfieldella rifensis]|uniref:Lipid-A-disaccharide synthase N-terminal domain-containing protein n=1 Tax=Litchfieldella rifensis TaxID=762643 RepID=A0ABV7LMZ5_9GAMM
MSQSGLWLTIGFLGQALFSARFLVQWLASERAGRSVIPLAFWFLSLAGGATLLAYALYRRDPVFVLGQGAGLIIYLRNLMLIRREAPRRESTA